MGGRSEEGSGGRVKGTKVSNGAKVNSENRKNNKGNGEAGEVGEEKWQK